jgi:hypothetical protein
MSGVVIDTTTLSESLHTFIKTPKVRIIEELDKVILIPQEENNSKYKCKLRGILNINKSIVDEYLAEKKEEKKKEL